MTNENCCIIWLHGLGADGNDFTPIVSELNLPDTLKPRFIFPDAPFRPITLNGGMRMRGWYDIYSMTNIDREDESGILESMATIDTMIEAQIASGIPSEKIIIAGFSQGGAIAMSVGLHFPKRLAGIISLSAYLPLALRVARTKHPHTIHNPFFIAHGDHDDVVPLFAAERSRDFLVKNKYDVTWRTYPIGHHVCNEEIKDIREFILSVF